MGLKTMTFFSALSIRWKILIAVLAVLPLPISAAGYAVVQLSTIETHTQLVAVQDIKITKALTNVTVAQLEQSIHFERSLAYGLQLAKTPELEPDFRRTYKRFLAKGISVKAAFDDTKRVIDIAIQAAPESFGTAVLERLRATLIDAQTDQLAYESLAGAMVSQLTGPNQTPSAKLLTRITALEDRLDRTLSAALIEVEGFTEEALLEVGRLERKAIETVAVASVLSIFAALLLGLFMARGISDPISSLTNQLALLTPHPSLGKAGRLTTHNEIEHLSVTLENYRESVRRNDELAREMSQTLAREREAHDMHREFLSMATHEFRTPLAIIDAAAQRLSALDEQSAVTEETGKRLASIRSNVNRVDALIQSILEISRLDSDALVPVIKDCNLTSLCRQITERYNDLYGTTQASVDADGECRIKADPAMIERIMENLVGNAFKYTPPKTAITIAISGTEDTAIVKVTDQGAGLSAAESQRIFQRYVRGDNAHGTPGTGLGLYMCRYLAELHGGTVICDSTENSGATFTLELPRVA